MLKENTTDIVHQIYEAAFDPTVWRQIFSKKEYTAFPPGNDERRYLSLKEVFLKLGVKEQILSQQSISDILSATEMKFDPTEVSAACQRFNNPELSMHIQQSLQFYLIVHKMQRYINELETLLNMNDRGIVIIDGNKKIICSNVFTERLFLKGIISRNQGVLYFSSGTNRKLDTCMAGASSDKNVHIQDSFLILDADNNSYAVRVKKIDVLSNVAADINKWMVTILPMSNIVSIPDEEIKRFCSLFAITEAEEIVVSAIIKSIPLHKVAENSNKKDDTVRKQLKSAMNKVGVSSQKQLIQLIERFSYSGV